VEQPSESGISQDDHYLSRAIQESMRETYNDQERYITLPLEQMIRRDNRWVLFVAAFSPSETVYYPTSPVAIRFTQGSLVYAALVFQGLYYVPQVRKSIASWRPLPKTPDAEFVSPPTSGEGPPDLAVLVVKLTSTHHLF
jgi:hypothetical protein